MSDEKHESDKLCREKNRKLEDKFGSDVYTTSKHPDIKYMHMAASSSTPAGMPAHLQTFTLDIYKH